MQISSYVPSLMIHLTLIPPDDVQNTRGVNSMGMKTPEQITNLALDSSLGSAHTLGMPVPFLDVHLKYHHLVMGCVYSIKRGHPEFFISFSPH